MLKRGVLESRKRIRLEIFSTVCSEERHSRVCSTPASYSEGLRFESRPEDRLF